MTNNENGNQKPFTLAPIKSPEEIALEGSKRIAPEIRRSVQELNHMSMSAKGFFAAILDYSYMYSYGGNGRGKLFASIRDLSHWLHHDKDSITSWRDVLVAARVLWVRDGWPKSEWRICALCSPPEHRGSEYQSIMARASSQEEMSLGEQSGNLPHTPPFSENPIKTEDFGHSGGQNTPHSAESFRRGGGILPHFLGETFRQTSGRIPTSQGKPSATLTETFRRVHRKFPPWEPLNPSILRRLLRRSGVLELGGGGSPPPKLRRKRGK